MCGSGTTVRSREPYAEPMSYARLTHDGAIERELILAREVRYTRREWGIVQLYYVCGFSHAQIAEVFHVARATITKSMIVIRRKAHGRRPYSDKPAPDSEFEARFHAHMPLNGGPGERDTSGGLL